MREKTKQTIATLERIPWFKNVGKTDVPKVKVLGSWSEAIERDSRGAKPRRVGISGTNSLPNSSKCSRLSFSASRTT